MIYLGEIASPLGTLVAGFTDKGLALLSFADISNFELPSALKVYDATTSWGQEHDRLKVQLDAYFDGSLTTFEIPLDLHGTEFQKKVWNLLLDVPYGETATYRQQSEKYGDLKAIRAVATANGANPIAIIVPCHRIIGSDASLTGYAGGLWRKKELLSLESNQLELSL